MNADLPAEFSENIRARLAKEPYLAPRAFLNSRGNRVYRAHRTNGKREWWNEEQMEAFLDEILQPLP